MASTSTKAVSFRVPVDIYVKLLEEAQSMGCNMTDLLFLRIFPQSNSPLDVYKKETEEKIQTLENELSTHKQQVQDLESENENLQQALNNQTIRVEESKHGFEGMVGNFSQMQKEYETKINRLTEQSKRAQALFADAEQRAMGLMTRNKSLEEACDNYEQEITQLKQGNMEQKAEIDTLNEALKNYEIAYEGVEEMYKTVSKDIGVLSKKHEQAKTLADKEAKDADNTIKRLTTRLTQIERENVLYKDEADSLTKKNKETVKKFEEIVFKLYDKHNQQIGQLKDTVSDWLSYTSDDEQMFQNCKWETN
jgi:chromosome segregation ATPase